MHDFSALDSISDKVSLPKRGGEQISPNYTSNNELLRWNNTALVILTKVSEYIDSVDNFDQIQKLLTEAIRYAQSIVVKDEIKSAKLSLKYAQRTLSWIRSRRKKENVDQHTLKKYVDSFKERVNAAVLELNKESAKLKGTYFSTLKATVFENLPYDLPVSKKTTVETAPVLVFIPAGVPLGKDYEQIQDNLFLIRNAKVVGVRRGSISFEAVNTKIRRDHKCEISPAIIPRITGNINWHLMLDFHVAVSSATFMSSMKLPGSASGITEVGMTLDHYARIAYEQEEQRKRILQQVNKEFRIAFETAEAELFNQRTYLKEKLQLFETARDLWTTEFKELTSPDGDASGGLHPNQYNQLDRRFEVILKETMSDIESTEDTRLAVHEQRLAAREVYYTYVRTREDCKRLRAELQDVEHQIEQRKAHFFLMSRNSVQAAADSRMKEYTQTINTAAKEKVESK